MRTRIHSTSAYVYSQFHIVFCHTSIEICSATGLGVCLKFAKIDKLAAPTTIASMLASLIRGISNKPGAVREHLKAMMHRFGTQRELHTHIYIYIYIYIYI